jgi:hypothetical protein
MDKPITRCRASLTILSSVLSADEIAQKLALHPDGSVDKGTPLTGNAGDNHRYTALTFESHLREDAELSAHIDELLRRLKPAKDAIRSLAGPAPGPGTRGAPVRLSLHIESSRRMLGVDLTADQLEAIAELGAYWSVEVDTDLDDANESSGAGHGT